MAITGKQVRQLRSMANNLKPTVIVGKEGVTANILKQVNEGLEAHELIKVSVLCETGSQAAEAGREIADQAEADDAGGHSATASLTRRTALARSSYCSGRRDCAPSHSA